MYRRAYAIALKKDLSPQTVAEFIGVLQRADDHIETMLASRVAVEITPDGPWDLVWENHFADEEGYQAYLVHPYHCNVIDQYMYREHPSAIISDIFCLRWDDEAPLPGVATGKRQ